MRRILGIASSILVATLIAPTTYAHGAPTLSSGAQISGTNPVPTDVITDSQGSLSSELSAVYSWNDPSSSYNFSNAKVVVVNRGISSTTSSATVPAALSTSILPSKTALGKSAANALAGIQNAPFLASLKLALAHGDFIVFTGNADGLLQDSLVDESLGVTGPQETHGSGLQAIGIYMPKGATIPIMDAFSYTKIPSLASIVQTVDYAYQRNVTKWNAELLSANTTSSSTTTTTGVAPADQYGSGNQYYYDNTWTTPGQYPVSVKDRITLS